MSELLQYSLSAIAKLGAFVCCLMLFIVSFKMLVGSTGEYPYPYRPHYGTVIALPSFLHPGTLCLAKVRDYINDDQV